MRVVYRYKDTLFVSHEPVIIPGPVITHTPLGSKAWSKEKRKQSFFPPLSSTPSKPLSGETVGLHASYNMPHSSRSFENELIAARCAVLDSGLLQPLFMFLLLSVSLCVCTSVFFFPFPPSIALENVLSGYIYVKAVLMGRGDWVVSHSGRVVALPGNRLGTSLMAGRPVPRLEERGVVEWTEGDAMGLR